MCTQRFVQPTCSDSNRKVWSMAWDRRRAAAGNSRPTQPAFLSIRCMKLRQLYSSLCSRSSTMRSSSNPSTLIVQRVPVAQSTRVLDRPDQSSLIPPITSRMGGDDNGVAWSSSPALRSSASWRLCLAHLSYRRHAARCLIPTNPRRIWRAPCPWISCGPSQSCPC